MKGAVKRRPAGEKAVRFIPAGLWYGVIWFFSSQTGSESQDVSDGVLGFFGYDILNSPMVLSELLSFLVRKAAHMGVFFVLAGLLYWALRGVRRRGGLALGLCVALAAVDELHQLFVPGRSGRWQDVVIDSLGGACLLGLAALVQAVRKRRRT